MQRDLEDYEFILYSEDIYFLLLLLVMMVVVLLFRF
jgi:hypothetical protein